MSPIEGYDKKSLKTRGVILTVRDMETLPEWPEKAKSAGITTIGTHVTPSQVMSFFASSKGRMFVDKCNTLGINVEHELHAMQELLPRELYEKNPDMFPMDESGCRVKEYNCCVHSKEAVEIICENAVKFARILTPTTGRYFYWFDDNRPMCRCPKCKHYTESEQALILENQILRALKRFDKKACLSHLAYKSTFVAPVQVKPEPGIFLEYAPIERRLDMSINDADAIKRDISRYDKYRFSHGQYLELLDENLKIFDRETSQIVEYWLDASLFSQWQYPAVKIPWNWNIFEEDIKTYISKGINNITSFAAYVDIDYVNTYGWPPIDEYGKGLCQNGLK